MYDSSTIEFRQGIKMKNEKAFKKRVFDIIQIGKRDDITSRTFDLFIVIAILLNIAVLFLQTFDELTKYQSQLKKIETVTMVIFLLNIC